MIGKEMGYSLTGIWGHSQRAGLPLLPILSSRFVIYFRDIKKHCFTTNLNFWTLPLMLLFWNINMNRCLHYNLKCASCSCVRVSIYAFYLKVKQSFQTSLLSNIHINYTFIPHFFPSFLSYFLMKKKIKVSWTVSSFLDVPQKITLSGSSHICECHTLFAHRMKSSWRNFPRFGLSFWGSIHSCERMVIPL